jgi:hypothetical protein
MATVDYIDGFRPEDRDRRMDELRERWKFSAIDAREEDEELNEAIRRSEAVQTRMDVNTFHSMMGHLGITNLKKTAADFGVELTGKWKDNCEHCAQANMRRAPINKVARLDDEMGPYTHIAIDVQPVSITGYGGAHYLIGFTDRHTSRGHVYTMVKKNGLKDAWNRLISEEVMRFKGWKGVIRDVRVDGGRELVNAELKPVFDSMGIHVSYTATDTPQQNAHAEQLLTQTDRTATALVAAANLEGNLDHLWIFAAYAANDIRNQQVTQRMGNKRSGGEPDRDLLAGTFGTRAWVKIVDKHQHYKTDRAMLCVYLGRARNAPRGTGIFYHIKTKRVIVRHDYKLVDGMRWDGSAFSATRFNFNHEEVKRQTAELKRLLGIEGNKAEVENRRHISSNHYSALVEDDDDVGDDVGDDVMVEVKRGDVMSEEKQREVTAEQQQVEEVQREHVGDDGDEARGDDGDDGHEEQKDSDDESSSNRDKKKTYWERHPANLGRGYRTKRKTTK